MSSFRSDSPSGRISRTAWSTIFAGIGCFGLSALTVRLGAYPMLIVAGVLFLALVARHSQIAFYALLAAAFQTFPVGVPSQLFFGGLSVYIYEPFLAIAVLVALVRLRPAHRSDQIAVWGTVAILLSSALSLLNGLEMQNVVGDVRPLLSVMGAIFVAGRVVGSEFAKGCSRIVSWILWTSAGLIGLSSVTGIAIAGRTESAALYLVGDGLTDGSASRIITGTTHLSLPILAAVLGMWVVGRGSRDLTIRFMLPALLITFVSFSRNSILGVGAAVLVCLVASLTVSTLIGVATRALVIAAVGVLAYFAAPLTSSLPGGQFVLNQLNSFGSRVIGGLTSSTLTADTSVLYRDKENTYLINAFLQQPFTGNGFGFAYKPPEGESGSFWADKGRFYAHNFYLWMAAKLGAVGLAGFIAIVGYAYVGAFRNKNRLTMFLAAGATSLLAVSFVAPMPLGSGSAISLGLFIGALTQAGGIDPSMTDSGPYGEVPSRRVSPKFLSIGSSLRTNVRNV
jgi:hypothetical protein